MLLSTREHSSFKKEELDELAERKDEFSKTLAHVHKEESKRNKKSLLGIDGDFKASYYVGCAWLQEPSEEDKEGIAIQVIPKEDVDYVKMLVTALKIETSNEAEYFSDYYHIDFDAPPIDIRTEENLITPLLLLHYVALLNQLVKSGLKKDYFRCEENLQSRVRGKILFSRHLKQNVFNKREDRVYCAYQEYTVNTPENRLLKKALCFTKNILLELPSFCSSDKDDVALQIQNIEYAFADVSDDFSSVTIASVKESKLFRHYAETIKVAKMILQYFDYDIEDSKSKPEEHLVRPFFIDMARLYEMYVYHKMNEAYPGKIQFQVKGSHKTQVDYIKTDEKIILDAKYKPRYNDGNAGIMDDIREISGYARDEKILKALDWKPDVGCINGDYLPKCVIVYPDKSAKFEPEDGCTDVECEEISSFEPAGILKDSRIKQIPGFRGFYKIAVPLPAKKVD